MVCFILITMPRPATKEGLLVTASEGFDKLWKLLESIDDPESFVFNFDETAGKEAHWKRDKNLRDVLAHLSEWHLLLGKWITENIDREGDWEPFLPEPYNWSNYGEMNMEFWKRGQSIPYSKAKDTFLMSHSTVMMITDSLSEEELFEKKHYPWTGTTNLASYCISATSSHYEWAMKKIKKQMKNDESK